MDIYKVLILSWLRDHPDMNAAQVFDWLKERDKDFKVGESTVRSYLKELREIYQIPRTRTVRRYQALPDPPMGEQVVQVDFGQTKQKKVDERKLNCTSYPLSSPTPGINMWNSWTALLPQGM